MRYHDLITESMTNNVTVFYGGRFQPMHQGHFALYKKLVSRFGADNVFIATTFSKDAQKQHSNGDYTKNPFSFEEKAGIISKMFGIPSNHILNTSPYRLFNTIRISIESALLLLLPLTSNQSAAFSSFLLSLTFRRSWIVS